MIRMEVVYVDDHCSMVIAQDESTGQVVAGFDGTYHHDTAGGT